MRKNYRFEILEFLFSSFGPGTDIRPFVNRMAKEEMFSHLYFTILLQSMQANNLISWHNEGNAMIARLQPEGVTEYHRLKQYCVVY